MNRSFSVLIGGCVALLVAISATASPPTQNFQNRTYGTWATGIRCNPIEYGERCNAVSVWENYDVKGEYEFSEVVVQYWFDRFFPDGSEAHGSRLIGCQVDRSTIKAYPNNRITFATVMDPAAPECYSDGLRWTWDPGDGYQESPWPFLPGPREAEGEWIDPFSHGKSTWIQHDTFHDGFSGTTGTLRQNCMRRWGDMTLGGFRFGQRFFAFEGVDSPTWSSFSAMSCIDHDAQR